MLLDAADVRTLTRLSQAAVAPTANVGLNAEKTMEPTVGMLKVAGRRLVMAMPRCWDDFFPTAEYDVRRLTVRALDR